MIRAIKLRCRTCGSDTCDRKPNGSWSSETEGCVKEVAALIGNQFFYYQAEVRPELKKLKDFNNFLWVEYEEFMQMVYDLPHGEHYKR